MGLITQIESQKHHRNRKSVYMDDAFVAGVHDDVVLALGLAVGQSLDESRLLELLRAESLRKAREKAIALVNYRDRSRDELRKRLIGSDFAEDIVEEVVEQFEETGLLDDEKFSREWVASRQASRPVGRARLARELRAKGVEPGVVARSLESVDDARQIKLALQAATRRMEKMDRTDPSSRQRLISFLARRGFDWDTIREVVRKLDLSDDD